MSRDPHQDSENYSDWVGFMWEIFRTVFADCLVVDVLRKASHLCCVGFHPSMLFHRIEFDRTWCIVDLDGTHAPKLEAISGRRVGRT